MRLLSGIEKRMPGRRAVIVIAVLAWGVLFFAGSLPSLKRTLDNGKKIKTVSERIEAMTAISSAGSWLEAVVEKMEPALIKEYDVLFPEKKEREELFLQLASLAGESGIDPFTLREIPILDSGGGSDGSVDEEAMDPNDEDMNMMIEEFAVDLSRLPDPGLQPFRLQVDFDSDYERMTRFISGLESIPRALTLHRLDIEPGPSGVKVIMELDCYAQKSD